MQPPTPSATPFSSRLAVALGPKYWVPVSTDYRKISVAFWSDDVVVGLAAEPKLVLLTLLTHPQLTPLGLVPAGIQQIAEMTGLKPRRIKACLSELSARKLIFCDPARSVVWIVKFLRYNTPATPTMIDYISKKLTLVPECAARREAVTAFIFQILSRKNADAWETYFLARWEHCLDPETAALFKPELVAKYRADGKPIGLSKGGSGGGSGDPNNSSSINNQEHKLQLVTAEAEAGAETCREPGPASASASAPDPPSADRKATAKAGSAEDEADPAPPPLEESAEQVAESAGQAEHPPKVDSEAGYGERSCFEEIFDLVNSFAPMAYDSPRAFDAASKALEAKLDKVDHPSTLLEMVRWALTDHPGDYFRNGVRAVRNPVCWMMADGNWANLAGDWNQFQWRNKGSRA